MDLKKLLEKVKDGFVRTGDKSAQCMSAAELRDAAVADIALMIAALDGKVQSEEFAAYRWIVSRCRGLSDDARRGHLDSAVRKAGHLLLMAQVDEYSDEDLFAAFSNAVREVLPNGFAGFSKTDIRRAFVLWTSAAVADGEVSIMERRAVTSLRESLSATSAIEPDFIATAERLLLSLADPEQRSEAESALDHLVVFA